MGANDLGCQLHINSFAPAEQALVLHRKFANIKINSVVFITHGVAETALFSEATGRDYTHVWI